MSFVDFRASIAVVAVLVAGCADAPEEPARVRQPDAVVVDFFTADHAKNACSGTLVAANVVLTAAHCADGSRAARVTAPEAGGRIAEVARVLRYDWTDEAD